MNAPHVVLHDNGDVSVRLSAEDFRILASEDHCKVLGLQDRVRDSSVVPFFEAALKSEAVS